MELPETLRLAIADVAERQPRQALERAATALSAAYRGEGATRVRARWIHRLPSLPTR